MNSAEDWVAPNPDYGDGIFRRRIRLTQGDHYVVAELEDCCHAMRLQLRHDGHRIVGMDGEVLRAPVTSCSLAPEKLQDFVGLALCDEQDSYRRATPAHMHCTHLYDMALLAIAHSQQAQTTQQVDITVADERAGLLESEIQLDGVLIHHWCLRGKTIEYPSEYGGQSVFKGFIAWAKQQFDGVALNCAFALQRGIMVAHARRWDMDSVAGKPAADFGPGLGVCYSYSDGRETRSVRSANSTRDFTHTPEQLLRFE